MFVPTFHLSFLFALDCIALSNLLFLLGLPKDLFSDHSVWFCTGTVSVAHASLGWNKPVHLEGITLKGIDGETVVSIPKIETRASLWSIVRGKTGFGAGLLHRTLSKEEIAVFLDMHLYFLFAL